MNDTTHHCYTLPPLSENKYSQKWEKIQPETELSRKDCGRQFIADHERRYQGAVPRIIDMIPIMLVRGMGIRDIAVSLSISVNKVLKSLTSSVYEIQPRHTHYDTLKVDEFWTYGERERRKGG